MYVIANFQGSDFTVIKNNSVTMTISEMHSNSVFRQLQS